MGGGEYLSYKHRISIAVLNDDDVNGENERKKTFILLFHKYPSIWRIKVMNYIKLRTDNAYNL